MLAVDVWEFVVREGDRWIESSSYRGSRPLLALHLHDLIHRHQVVVEVSHDPERSADHKEHDQDAERQRQHGIGVVRPRGDVQENNGAAAPDVPWPQDKLDRTATDRCYDRARSRALFEII